MRALCARHGRAAALTALKAAVVLRRDARRAAHTYVHYELVAHFALGAVAYRWSATVPGAVAGFLGAVEVMQPVFGLFSPFAGLLLYPAWVAQVICVGPGGPGHCPFRAAPLGFVVRESVTSGEASNRR